MIRIGIVGAGRMGRIHAQNLLDHAPRATIVAVADETEDLAATLDQKTGAVAFTDHRELLRRAEVDAILVCTPLFTHKRIVLDALAAGKHVFCEKPLALSLEENEEICQAVEGGDRIFQMAFMRRFDRAFVSCKQKLQQGAIGRPVFVRSSGRDPGLPPVPGWGSDPALCGDIAFELCSHDFDSLQWLLGSDIKLVYARASILSALEAARASGGKMINDTIVICLEFENGALGSIDGLLNIKYGYDARVEVVGDAGLLCIGDMRDQPLLWGTADKQLCSPAAASFADRFAPAYVEQIRHFLHCVATGDSPRVGVQDGLKAAKVAAAVNESIKSGRSALVE